MTDWIASRERLPALRDASFRFTMFIGGASSNERGTRTDERYNFEESDEVLAYVPHDGRGDMYVLYLEKGRDSIRGSFCTWTDGRDEYPLDAVTHWMPLPAPPTNASPDRMYDDGEG